MLKLSLKLLIFEAWDKNSYHQATSYTVISCSSLVYYISIINMDTLCFTHTLWTLPYISSLQQQQRKWYMFIFPNDWSWILQYVYHSWDLRKIGLSSLGLVCECMNRMHSYEFFLFLFPTQIELLCIYSYLFTIDYQNYKKQKVSFWIWTVLEFYWEHSWNPKFWVTISGIILDLKYYFLFFVLVLFFI